ncbi:hypothetical protein [Paenibacillus rhizophilus]|uniref:Uncharacterized protein n=1 Tax=Paenibacillus rhizophilus TaxID=1850366 RepID=A0A3N9P5U2_9BACL|nr:hypothetical protein [Paenibacillus rhizophilus]RQW11593.1 hypothetical protein EH198_11275 [Paenibacillus rhizophilus]
MKKDNWRIFYTTLYACSNLFVNRAIKFCSCIEVNGINDGRIRATGLTTGAQRVFLMASVLAWRPFSQAAG